MRGAEDWERFFAWLQEERCEATHASKPRRTDPFWNYPLDPVSKDYVDSVLRAVPGYEGDTVNTVFADSLLDFSPERDLGHLSKLPVLIAHGDQNALHPTVEALSLFERYPGPNKELYWIEGGGHTEWMDDDSRYKQLAGRIADWLDAL